MRGSFADAQQEGGLLLDEAVSDQKAVDEGIVQVPLDPALEGQPLPEEVVEGEATDEILTGAIPELESDVFALRDYTITDEGVRVTTEPASTGLTGNGQAQRIAPFSQRVERVGRVQTGAGRISDEAFDGDTRFDAAEGFRVGTFTILPQVVLRAGYSDNTSSSANGEPGAYLVIEPRVDARSDWSRHGLTASLSGSLTSYLDDDQTDANLASDIGLRLDLSDQVTGTGDLGYSLSEETSSSAEGGGQAETTHQITAGAGLSRDLGLVIVEGRLALEHSLYEETASRDNTLYSTGLRLDANTGAVLRPFMTGDVFLRRFDQTCSDSSCEDRDSWGYELRLGTVVDRGAKLAGDISAGWRSEMLDDSTLSDLNGLIAEANLVWSPTRRTTVTAGLNTEFETSSLAGTSGSIIYAGDLRVAQDFGDRLAAEVGGGYSLRRYEGSGIEEETFTGLAGLTFALTRNAALQAQYSYTAFETSESGGDYVENSIEAGVRIRH